MSAPKLARSVSTACLQHSKVANLSSSSWQFTLQHGRRQAAQQKLVDVY